MTNAKPPPDSNIQNVPETTLYVKASQLSIFNDSVLDSSSVQNIKPNSKQAGSPAKESERSNPDVEVLVQPVETKVLEPI